MRMAVAHRNHSVAAIKISVNLTILVPQCSVESFDWLDIPQFIYFE
jgi:hypothetical protein